MSGQMKRYNLHASEYQKLPEPIPMPKIKLDIRGIVKYAKNKKIQVVDLTEKEKKLFIK